MISTHSERSGRVDIAVVYILNRLLLDLKGNAFTFYFKKMKITSFRQIEYLKASSVQSKDHSLFNSSQWFYPI